MNMLNRSATRTPSRFSYERHSLPIFREIMNELDLHDVDDATSDDNSECEDDTDLQGDLCQAALDYPASFQELANEKKARALFHGINVLSSGLDSSDESDDEDSMSEDESVCEDEHRLQSTPWCAENMKVQARNGKTRDFLHVTKIFSSGRVSDEESDSEEEYEDINSLIACQQGDKQSSFERRANKKKGRVGKIAEGIVQDDSITQRFQSVKRSCRYGSRAA